MKIVNRKRFIAFVLTFIVILLFIIGFISERRDKNVTPKVLTFYSIQTMHLW